MEKRINKRVDDYITTFKNGIKDKIAISTLNNKQSIAELLEFIYDYDRLQLTKEDFIKRKRVKNAIPNANRCIAKRANGEQCTRRRKDEACEFCGTHSKGTPHGLIQGDVIENDKQKIEAFAEDINGIVYYIDKYQNVYKTEDILSNKENPLIVAKAVKNGTQYSIPEFGLISTA